MDWKEFITKLTPSFPGVSLSFFEPAGEELFQTLKSELNLKEVPAELIDFWLQTNGAQSLLYIEQHKESIVNDWLVYSIDETIFMNKLVRNNDYLEPGLFDEYLFFCPAGNGDLFGFKFENGELISSTIYDWNHEDNDIRSVASDMKTFIKNWVEGNLSI